MLEGRRKKMSRQGKKKEEKGRDRCAITYGGEGCVHGREKGEERGEKRGKKKSFLKNLPIELV